MTITDAQGVYGSGTYVDTTFTPVPEEARRILKELAVRTPGFSHDQSLINGVRFEGSDLPCVPGPIKVVAVTAALHAMVGIVGHEILRIRGIHTDGKTTINTDHAGLHLGSVALPSIDGIDGAAAVALPTVPQYTYGKLGTPVKLRTSAIYKTKTPGAWYQLHGSTDPYPVLKAIGADSEIKLASGDEAYRYIEDHVMRYSARDVEMLMVENGLCGSIVYAPDAWLQTTMGALLATHPLVDYKKQSFAADSPPVDFPPMKASDHRPLAGVKVLELSRIIAAPAAGSILSSLGAEVIRVQVRDALDFTPSQLCLTAGKRTYDININDGSDRAILRRLFEDADVILQGYRLGSLTRRGFGLDAALEVAKRRGRGVVYLDENCYGPEGYYAERPGWQQIADAAAGSSFVTAKAYGFPDGQGVLPSLPISDMSTGIVGAITIMSMLRDRAKYGGSWHGNASLTAFNMMTLEPWVGLYQPSVVAEIQDLYRFRPMTSDLHVIELYLLVLEGWKTAGKERGELMRNEKFFVHFRDSVYGKDLRILAPVVQYDDPKSAARWTSPPVPFCHFKNPSWEAN